MKRGHLVKPQVNYIKSAWFCTSCPDRNSWTFALKAGGEEEEEEEKEEENEEEEEGEEKENSLSPFKCQRRIWLNAVPDAITSPSFTLQPRRRAEYLQYRVKEIQLRV